MSSRSEAVAVAGDVCEEAVKHVVLTVPHSQEQSFVGVNGKLLTSGISRAIETEPDILLQACNLYSITTQTLTTCLASTHLCVHWLYVITVACLVSARLVGVKVAL